MKTACLTEIKIVLSGSEVNHTWWACFHFKMLRHNVRQTENYQKETNTTILTQRNFPTGLIGLSSSLRAL